MAYVKGENVQLHSLIKKQKRDIADRGELIRVPHYEKRELMSENWTLERGISGWEKKCDALEEEVEEAQEKAGQS